MTLELNHKVQLKSLKEMLILIYLVSMKLTFLIMFVLSGRPHVLAVQSWPYPKFSSWSGTKVCNDHGIHSDEIYCPQNMSVCWDVYLFAQNSVYNRFRLVIPCTGLPPWHCYQNLWWFVSQLFGIW